MTLPAQPPGDPTLDPPRAGTSVDVRLTTEPLSIDAAYAAVIDPTCGGIGLFCGVVRNHHDGDEVSHLEYEAWEEQVEPAMRAVAERVLAARPALRSVHISHRVGRLEIGDLSVIVAAAAPHRDEAIAAAQELIDDVKASVPIWKHEFLVDGTERWPGC